MQQPNLQYQSLNFILSPSHPSQTPTEFQSIMLDYFNTRQQQPTISPLKRKPHIDFGISIQSPQQFQKPFSMISRNTFVNPYLSYEKARKSCIPVKKTTEINPHWTRKIDINQVQTERTFLKNDNQLGKLQPQSRYYKQLSMSKTRFRLTKGQFTNFLQRNHSNELFGPLQGMQRDKSKSILTKTIVAKKSRQKLSQNFDRLTQYRSRLFQSREPFQQKHSLQKTRFAFRQGFKNQLQQRKTRTTGLYTLPQLMNNTQSSMKHAIESEHQVQQKQNPQKTMLSNRSIERLHDLRDFNYTQRYFTLEVRVKNEKKQNSLRREE